MRANVHARSGEVDAAFSLLNMAIEKYSAMDHVYSETMTAWALFSRGRASERVGDFGSALADFERAREFAETNDHRLAIGSHWLHATLGLSRLAFRRGETAHSDALLSAASSMHERKERFVWVNIPGGMEPETFYELAATYAFRGDTAQALATLEHAARIGWCDAYQLGSDPNFDRLRDSTALRQLIANATVLVTLPTPVGSGGFPDFEETRSSDALTLQPS